MLKELIAETQPVVYHALENAIHDRRLSHAYLFTGPAGTPKKEAALLLAASIFCEKQDGFACEKCNTCRRVLENSYLDFVLLDGSQKSISKEDVDAVQAKFSATASEINGNKVYVILNAENASIPAMNSMLKFLEEPAAGVTAILTTDNTNRILSTIISRCTMMPFVPMKTSWFHERALEAGIPEQDAWFLSHIVKRHDALEETYKGNAYKKALQMFRQFLGLEGKRKELLVDYDISFRSDLKDKTKAKKENIEILTIFFSLLSLYAHDVIMDTKGDSWYFQAVANAKGEQDDYGKLIRIVTEEKDRCNKYNDLNLLMDQAFLRLEEWYERTNG